MCYDHPARPSAVVHRYAPRRKSGCTVLYFLRTQLNPTEEEMSEITGKKAK
jgi:hypothetical protein